MKKLWFVALLMVLIIPFRMHAQGFEFDPGGEIAQDLNLTTTPADTMTIDIVRYILTYIGLVAVLVILYGGIRYMMAGGNEETIKKARAILKWGIIGLVVILLSFAIVTFVVGKVPF